MPIVADAAVAVRGDLTKFNQDLKGAGKGADTLGQKMSAALSPRNLAAGLGIGFGIAKVSQLIGGAIQDASDLAESMSKVDVVFGESAKEVQAWASTSAEAFGQSKQAALEAAGTYGNLFQAFGIGQQKSKEMSTSLVQLAADLASFNNTSVEDAILALRSGLSGETEPLKRYGVAISDVRLRQEALSLGLIKTTSEVMPPAIKAQATYSLVMKDTALAQGDFERTSDGLANQQRILTAQFEDLSAELGEKLLPVVVDLVTFLNEDGVPALREFGEVTADNVETIVRGVERVVGAYNLMRDGVLGVLEVLPGEAGFWAEETEKSITGPMDKMWSHAEEAAHDGVVRMASAFEEGTPAVLSSVSGMALAILKILDIQQAKMRNLGFQHQVEYAKGLLDAQNNVKVAIEAALQIVEDEMTKQEEIAFLSGQRGTLMLARGIASAEGKEASVLAIDGALALLRQRLGDLGVEFYTSGKEVGISFGAGLNAAYGYVRTAAGNLAAATRGQLGVNSEPKDPSSPLRGITKAWGFGDVLAKGMLTGTGSIASAGAILASAMMPGFGSAGIGTAGVGATGAGPTFNYNLSLSGVSKNFNSEQDMLDALKDLSAFGEGRLS